MVITKILIIPVGVQGQVGWGIGVSGLVEGVLDHGKKLEQDDL